MKKILLCQHGGSGNHGCEALVRTVYALIKDASPESEITLYSYKKGDDEVYLSDLPVKIEGLTSFPGKYSFYNLAYHAKSALGISASKIPVTGEFKTLVRESDLVIAIGGDNYCYDKGKGYYPSDAFIRDNAKKYVLFGCSIEPRDVPDGLGEHLKKTFDAITVRESISFEALNEYGVTSASLVTDPAFLLKAENAPEKQNAVGINISPLALNCGNKDAILSSYVALVQYILNETDMTVCLTPHVVWKDNDDRFPLTLIKKAFNENDRVVIIP